jgi:hypothetical protein
VRGDTAFLFGPYEKKQTMFCWKPGEKPRELGRRSGTLRGLEWGRFLSNGERGFTIAHEGE